MIKYKTRKLFYGKWIYKIECNCHEVWRLKYLGFPKNFLSKVKTWASIKKDTLGLERDLLAFSTAVFPFLKEDVSTRIEGRTFSLYCRNIDLFKNIIENLKPWISNITEPSTNKELEFLLKNGYRKIICKKFPDNIYRYKLSITRKTPLETREKFLQWANVYKNKIKVFSSILTYGNPCPNIYVIDEKMLSMVLLYLGSYCTRVDEFILEFSINT
jgi:hypothetical protein